MSELDLARTRAVIEEGMAAGLHLGAQLAVCAGGARAELVLGLGAPDAPMTRDTLLPWFSMTKAVTSVCALQQWERGAFDLDDPVASVVPEFGANGKEGVTIRHLLTHTGGFRLADGAEPGALFSRRLEDSVAMICAAPLEDGWIPGRRAGYHRSSGMAMLAEIVQRCDGREFGRYARDEVFVPLGMTGCWIGMPAAVQEAAAGDLGVMHHTAGPNPNRCSG